MQLNIISTRNPSFWWHFSPTTAPAPAALLVVPVFFFLLAATFVAVYWPPRIKPDGGLGFMDGVSLSTQLTIYSCIIVYSDFTAALLFEMIGWALLLSQCVAMEFGSHIGVSAAWLGRDSACVVLFPPLVVSI